MKKLEMFQTDITLFIKFLTSIHCDFIPKDIRFSDKKSKTSVFAKGCKDLLESVDK